MINYTSIVDNGARGDWPENPLIDRNEVQIEDNIYNMQGCNEANEANGAMMMEHGHAAHARA